MGHPFHLSDTILSASKSLETYYICNCLVHKHGLVLSKLKKMCTAHVLICGFQADMHATLVHLKQECDYNECMHKKLS